MAAGCVPMVIAAGGQVEIVTQGRNGFLWSSLEDLKKQVRRFVMLGPEAVVAGRLADCLFGFALRFLSGVLGLVCCCHGWILLLG